MNYACARCGGMILRFGLDREVRCMLCGRRPGEQPVHVEPARKTPDHYGPKDIPLDAEGHDKQAARQEARVRKYRRYAEYRRRSLSNKDAAAQVGVSVRQAHRIEKGVRQ